MGQGAASRGTRRFIRDVTDKAISIDPEFKDEDEKKLVPWVY